MQIVIDIPSKLYSHIQNDSEYYLEDGEELYTIVKNGTLLPKGHGRLIDADRASAVARDTKTDEDGRIIRSFLNALSPIIKADAESEGKE